jgi:hypothetical protein
MHFSDPTNSPFAVAEVDKQMVDRANKKHFKTKHLYMGSLSCFTYYFAAYLIILGINVSVLII